MQSTLTTFFAKSAAKRPAGAASQSSPAKRAKESENAGQNGSVLQQIPDDVDELIKMRKAEALAKRSAKLGELYQLEKQMGPTWFSVLFPQFEKPYFKKLKEFLQAEKGKGAVIYPPEHQIYEWTRMCAFGDVKVVIIGQDPYHGPGQAHGLCFSVVRGVRPPPSLINIYKELETDIPGFKAPDHGSLVGWARQGVLLLNACLTVRQHEANSHAGKGWEEFTDAVIEALTKKHSGLVFLLWGSYAQKKGSRINGKTHHVLKGVHPSPLSAHRGFFGCKHFSKTNELLRSMNKTPIDWQDLGEGC